MEKCGRKAFGRAWSQGAGRSHKGGRTKRIEGAGRSRHCYDRLRWSRLDMKRWVYVDDVHVLVIMNNLFVVETSGNLDHNNYAGE